MAASSLTGADLILGSSVVEQPAVNRLVAGSNPARGAILKATVQFLRRGFFFSPPSPYPEELLNRACPRFVSKAWPDQPGHSFR